MHSVHYNMSRYLSRSLRTGTQFTYSTRSLQTAGSRAGQPTAVTSSTRSSDSPGQGYGSSGGARYHWAGCERWFDGLGGVKPHSRSDGMTAHSAPVLAHAARPTRAGCRLTLQPS